MKVTVSSDDITKSSAQCVVVFISEKEKSRVVSQLDTKLNGAIARLMKAEEFSGKNDQILLLPTLGGLPSSYIALVGVGAIKDLTPFLFQKAAARIAKQLTNKKVTSIGVSFSDKLITAKPIAHLAQYAIEGFSLGSYVYTAYKSQKAQKNITHLTHIALCVDKKQVPDAQKGATQGQVFSEGTYFARDLVNESPSHLTPEKLATVAQSLKNASVDVVIYNKKQIEKMGMHAYLSVARGSHDEPRLIQLTYKPKKKASKRIVIIGKGITFDTGGLSLKPSKGMETMKMDMAGAASVLGIFRALPQLQPAVEVVGLIAATDNVPGPRATKPGDVVTAYNGKTIEVLNTDAEGRMTLADMLSFASEKKPAAIIDMATLTGACLVALGQQIAGLFGSNEDFTQQIQSAAHKAGEKMWQLPLEDEYRDLMKSNIADLRNISKNRYGGTITAALFLQEFVADDIPWVHIDIAGPAFEESGTAIVPKGGSGFGVRTILTYLQNA